MKISLKKNTKCRTLRHSTYNTSDLTENQIVSHRRAVKCFLTEYCFWHCSAVLRCDKTHYKLCWSVWSVNLNTQSIDTTHNSTALHSQTQKETAAEVSLSHQHKLNKEEETLSTVKVFYSQLNTTLKEFKKERKT